LDVDLVRQLADDLGVRLAIEEGSIGGFGDLVLHFLSIPDTYFEAATQFEQ
jgi:1-deoxy-D-xylulose-5-phosphate synthase